MILFENDQLKLTEQDDNIFIHVSSAGLTINDFNVTLRDLPQIKLSSFTILQNALLNADNTPCKIGVLKPEIEVEITSDEMAAYIRVNLPLNHCLNNHNEIVTKILQMLEEKSVCEGILPNALKADFEPGRKVLVAEGEAPVAGQDAKYQYFKLSEKKPEMSNTGKADHYELNLINNIKEGDWLGEKTPPLLGEQGFTVLGTVIPPKAGRDYSLKYDHSTIILENEKDKEVLRAKQDGAVRFIDGKITVDNHMHIKGDVDFKTGNIRFDGFVTIEGTVKDKFIVEATKDIEIKGDTGIGAVGRIESQDGSVYIRGGINGKNEAMIIAKENIFAMFSNECILIAGNAIHIGLYTIDSTLKADEIHVDPTKGRIIGGEIHAVHKIVSGSIGNVQERKTRINVEGFERSDIKAQLDAAKVQFQEIISKANRLRRQMEVYEMNMDALDNKAKTTYQGMMVNYENILDDINRLNNQVTKLEGMLRTRGDGEVKILNSVFPRTFLEIKSLQKHVNKLMTCSFYVKDRQLHTATD